MAITLPLETCPTVIAFLAGSQGPSFLLSPEAIQLPPACSTWQQDASGMRTSHLLLNAFPRLAWTSGSSMVVRRALRHLAATCCLSSLPGSLWGPEIQYPSVTSEGGGALCVCCSHWPWLVSSSGMPAAHTSDFPPLRRLWMVALYLTPEPRHCAGLAHGFAQRSGTAQVF